MYVHVHVHTYTVSQLYNVHPELVALIVLLHSAIKMGHAKQTNTNYMYTQPGGGGGANLKTQQTQ